MPDEEALPPGPRRDLITALYGLYTAAGRPSTRDLAAAITNDNALSATVSRETLGQFLKGRIVPDWPRTESVVRRLAADSVHPADPDEEVRRFHQLWCTARDTDSATAPPNTEAAGHDAQLTLRDVVSPIAESTEGEVMLFAGHFATQHSLDMDTPVPSRLLMELLATEVIAVRRALAKSSNEADAATPEPDKAQDPADAGRADNGWRTGTVKWFNSEKGYGFISVDPDGSDVFVHYAEVEMEGYRDLDNGQRVRLVVETSDKGPMARQVRPIP